MTDSTFLGLGWCIQQTSDENQPLDAFFPNPIFKPNSKLIQIISQIVTLSDDNVNSFPLNETNITHLIKSLQIEGFDDLAQNLQHLIGCKNTKLIIIKEDLPITSLEEAYLKLHFLSGRYTLPNSMNLSGIFPVLPNIAWTNLGPILPSELPQKRLESFIQQKPFIVYSIDKFPMMTNYISPSNIRIADTSRVRLGAYIGEGSTFMHEGFANFNSGCIGPNMVEGRISQGVIVGAHSDIGGGASIMGTLSGGGKEVISIGENTLIGANAGTGISLGDRCTIEAGTYVTSGMKVTLYNAKKELVGEKKAYELSGKDDLVFIKNTLSGRLECHPNKASISLNMDLHSND